MTTELLICTACLKGYPSTEGLILCSKCRELAKSDRLIMPGLIFNVPGPPVYLGSWWLDPNPTGVGTRFHMIAKPTDEQIANTEQTFGWKWDDL